jgi:hypothetical protein
MRRSAGFLVLVFASVVGFSASVNASADALWSHGAPTVLSNTEVTKNLGPYCTGDKQNVVVTGLTATYTACMYGSARLKIGYFGEAGLYRGVVKFSFSDDVHLLDGVCDKVVCNYSADSDILVTLQPIDANTQGLVVYRHASKRIHRLAFNSDVTYTFDVSHPDYEVKNDAGTPIWAFSFTLSDNGKWLVVELHNSGLALINTDSFVTRQIITSGYQHGYGMDPSEELAVSNDGKSVALMGQNVGFNVIDVTSGCGQSLLGDLHKLSTTVQCTSVDLDIEALFPDFQYAVHPRFIDDGHELEVIVNRWNGVSRRVTFLANGATAAPQLQLLSLGDSFTSGEGETDMRYYEPGTDDTVDACHVSTRAYPFLVANALGIRDDARSVACAGAKTSDIIGSVDDYWGQGERLGVAGLKLSSAAKVAAQDQAVDTFQPGRTLQSAFLERYNPEKITIGIGGNDVGLMGKLSACAMPGTCEWAYGDGLRATVGEIQRLYGTLGELFAHVTKTNPDAQVYVVGYPAVINPEGVCDPVTGFLFDYTERVFIQKSLEYMNQIIHAAVVKAGFTYLDIAHSLDGKGLCSGFASTAMNGLRIGDDISVTSSLPMLKLIGSGTFHPTPVGHVLVAESILASHPGLVSDATCASDPMVCAVAMPSIEPSAYWGVGDGVTRSSFVSDFVTQVATDAHQIVISVPEDTFEPQTSVRVEIHSDPRLLGTFATENGGINETVAIPLDTEVGFHTLHLFGTNREGEPIDVYEFVTIGQDGAVVAVGSSGEGVNTLGPQPETNESNGTGVLGAQEVTSKGLIRPIESSRPIVAVIKTNGIVIIAAIGAGIVSLGVLWIILRRRRWAKPSS